MPPSCQAYVQGECLWDNLQLTCPVHCSMLAEDAIKSAISNYYTKHPKTQATDLAGTGGQIPDVKVEIEQTPAASA